MTHHRPGFGPAYRVLTGTTASEEQRKAAEEFVGEVYPEDVLWAAPGTRRLTDEELATLGMEPKHVGRVVPTPEPFDWIEANAPLVALMGWTAAITIGLAGGLSALFFGYHAGRWIMQAVLAWGW